MKTINLRKAVRTILLNEFDRVYYSAADDSQSFPYAIFTIEEVTTVDGVVKCELEINACDYGRDTAALENKCDAVEKALDHYYYEDDNIASVSYLARRNNVASDDTNIIRRRIVFDINLYVKEN